MRHLCQILLLCCLLPVAAQAASVEAVLAKSRSLAEEKHYDESLALLAKAQAGHPHHDEITLAMAQVLAWKGDYAAAEARLDELSAKSDSNADVKLLRGSLAYYRKDYAASEQLYRAILVAHPDYTDAQDGLARVMRAQTVPDRARWQLDTGYEHSGFERRNQTSWNQEFLQLTHFLDAGTALHGKLTRYEQFSNIDSEYELGIDHAFAPFASAYAYGVVSPSADFRPNERLSTGGALRLINRDEARMPFWLTLDSRYDHYEATTVVNVNPGLRIEPWDGWGMAARLIVVDQANNKRVYGNDYRLDGTLTDRTRFYLGYADAPETVAGVTVDTQTVFGGLAIDATDDTTLRLGYARDDRENSYIRHVLNASVGYRF